MCGGFTCKIWQSGSDLRAGREECCGAAVGGDPDIQRFGGLWVDAMDGLSTWEGCLDHIVSRQDDTCLLTRQFVAQWLLHTGAKGGQNRAF